MKTYFTSESVTCGHPDKVCDQIADAVLDDILANDPDAHVACEVTACTGEVHLMGEITSSYVPDYEAIARKVIAEIGYTVPDVGFDTENVRIRVSIHTQSPDIARGVDRGSPEEAGAGDQGMMFGYACCETGALMPLPITLANRLTRKLEQVRREKLLPYLLPDGKAQVSVEYEDGKPKRISAVVVSAQHSAEVGIDALRDAILEQVIFPVLPPELLDEHTEYFINPTGRFVVGGPQDHRRHLWRHGAPRRRGVLGQGPEQGRPHGRLHGALSRQEHCGRGAGRPLRDRACLCHRPRRPCERDGRHVWHGARERRKDRELAYGAYRHAPRQHHVAL